jgi:hypothetical protein
MQVSLGLGFSHQGVHGARIQQAVGGHLQASATRWQSPRLAVRADLTGHTFAGTGCDGFCGPRGTDWLLSVSPSLVMRPASSALPLYGLIGIGGYYGGAGGTSDLQAGGNVGVGLAVLRRRRTIINAEARYHRFAGDVAGTNYLLPLSMGISW